ncbi:MAG: NADH-quinone oxidoreductase subunit N [Dehalococcoidia bacterium]
MTGNDVYLISPLLALAGLGIFVILLDLVVTRKGWLVVSAFIGLALPLAFSVLQILDVNGLIGGPATADLVPDGSVLAASLSVDRFGLFFNFLVLAAAGLVVLASTDYIRRMERLQGEYLGLILLSATGMMLMVAASELITIYISLELTTLPLAALAAFLLSARSSEAGMKFLIIGALSSAIMLYGMALIFGFSGTTSLEGIAASFQNAPLEDIPKIPFGSYAMLVGVVLLVVGFGFKISSVPFQMWVPDVYEGAPTPVVAFLSVASKAAAFALLLRVFYTGFSAVDLDWGILLAVLAAASMTVGNLAALAQSNLRRLFGYSAIAHAGYILIGVAAVARDPGLSTALGPSSVLFYLGAYTAANLTAFFAIIAIGHRIDSDQIDDYAGMARRSPFLAVALALSLIALIGVPPTSIFIAKIYIFTAAVNSGLAWLAILGVINSVVSAYYYLRVIRVMFLQPAPSTEGIQTSVAARFALAVAGAAMVWMGIAPGMILHAAESAASVLAGVSLR